MLTHGGKYSSVRLCVPTILWACLAPAALTAQAGEGPTLDFTGRVHAQWNHTSADGAIGSHFFIRRARVTALVRVNDLVSGKIQPDFAGGKATLKDTYFKLDFSPFFSVTMGQFKRPFDLFELESSTRSLVVERAGGVRGAGDCAGVGGVCSLSRFTEKLGYSERDVGVMASGRLGASPLSYSVSITNGEGENKADVNPEKSYTARVEYSVQEDLRFAANVGIHDYENAVDPTEGYGTAWGVDVDWGSYDPGLHLQWGLVGGDNWKNLSLQGRPSTFLTTQGIVSYRFLVTATENLSGVEPLFRMSWADPDVDIAGNGGLLMTAGGMLHFIGRNRLAVNFDLWDPDQGASVWSLKVQTSLHF